MQRKVGRDCGVCRQGDGEKSVPVPHSPVMNRKLAERCHAAVSSRKWGHGAGESPSPSTVVVTDQRDEGKLSAPCGSRCGPTMGAPHIAASAISPQQPDMLDAAKHDWREVSRHMLRHEASLLHFKVMEHTSKPIMVMPVFTVPKNTRFLRLILDCQKINRLVDDPPKMHLPLIHDVINNILENNWMTQCDGTSYFYQFELPEEIRPFFSAKLGASRNIYKTMQFTRMPIGWSWAPA